jgi:N-acetylmuramic acid 6-phosphate etherase
VRFELARQRFDDDRFVTRLARIVDAAATALQDRGSVVYFGSGTAGALAVIDASECPPTFGATADQVRAQVAAGYSVLVEDLALIPDLERRLSIDQELWRQQGATLAPRSLSLALHAGGRQLVARAEGRDGVALDLGNAADELVAWLRLKLVLNAISTGAFIGVGKVYGNRMIDLRLSNQKLFQRAVRIVTELARVAEAAAERAVIGAIHGTEAPSREQLAAPVAVHVERATKQSRVVPLAILMAAGGLDWRAANELLDREPIVRRALAQVLP